METVPFVDLSAAPEPFINARRQAAFDAIDGGIYVGGPAVAEFENEWASYVGVKGAVGVGNGLDALTIGLEALGIWPGARVAVPAHTFIATWIAVLRAGGSPLSVDIDDRGQLDLFELFSLDPKPDFVIPVHMHGAMLNMPALVSWANSNGVRILEDASQAHGAESSGLRAGAGGHATAFSMYPSKNLGAFGDAGILVSDDDGVLDKARRISQYGADREDKYKHTSLGCNSRLDTIQAKVLKASLPFLDGLNRDRRRAASSYLDALASFGLEELALISTPSDSVWHHFVVKVPGRDELRGTLNTDFGIQTEVHYPHAASDEISRLTGIKFTPANNAQRLASTGLSLPLFPGISESQIDRVTSALRKVLGTEC